MDARACATPDCFGHAWGLAIFCSRCTAGRQAKIEESYRLEENGMVGAAAAILRGLADTDPTPHGRAYWRGRADDLDGGLA